MKKAFFLIITFFLLGACGSNVGNDLPQALGSSSASILVEMFADLECSVCATVSPEVKKIVNENSDLAHLDFYHFPLSVHPYAFVAAEASECAADQGLFWEYVDMVYENQANLNEDYLFKIADALELDRDDFDQCMQERKYKEKVQGQMSEGVKRNLVGTPTIFVNGEKVEWTTAEDFEVYLKSP